MGDYIETILVIDCPLFQVRTLRKLTWKPKKGFIKTIVLLKEGYMGFHVSLGECMSRAPHTTGQASGATRLAQEEREAASASEPPAARRYEAGNRGTSI